MTRIQKRIDSFLYDTGGYSTQRIAVHRKTAGSSWPGKAAQE